MMPRLVVTQGQEAPVLLEPGNAKFVIGHNLCHAAPEFWRMIPDAGMGKFVHDHVVDYFRRGQDEPPGETEGAIGTARTPAGAGGGDADLLPGEVILPGLNGNFFRKEFQGPGFIPADEGLPGFWESGSCQKETVAGELEGGALRANHGQWNFFPQIKKRFAFRVTLLRRRRRGFSLGLFEADPLGVALDEFPDMGFGHAEGGTDGEGAIALNDDGDGLAPGVDEAVNGDRHGSSIPKGGMRIPI